MTRKSLIAPLCALGLILATGTATLAREGSGNPDHCKNPAMWKVCGSDKDKSDHARDRDRDRDREHSRDRDRHKGEHKGEHRKHKSAHDDRRDDHRGPRIGDNGRHGHRFERAANSRYKAAPRGQEYRVIDDTLVLIDKRSQKIVRILGVLR